MVYIIVYEFTLSPEVEALRQRYQRAPIHAVLSTYSI